MGNGMLNKAQRALAALRGGKGKHAGPWPLCERAAERMDIIDADFRRETKVVKLRAASRVEEVIALLRPEAAPKEAVYNPATRAFVLPEGQPVPEEAKTPEAADAAFEAERAKARDAMLAAEDEEESSSEPEPEWTK